MKKLSPKMRKWLKAYLDETNKETFGNATASARVAGYKCKNPDSFEAIGHQNFRKLQDDIEKWLDESALSDAKLKKLLAEGLQAFETRFFAYQGSVITEKTVIPWEIRRKYLEMALKVKGLFAPEKHQITGKGGGPLEYDAVKGRTEELKAKGDKIIEAIGKDVDVSSKG